MISNTSRNEEVNTLNSFRNENITLDQTKKDIITDKGDKASSAAINPEENHSENSVIENLNEKQQHIYARKGDEESVEETIENKDEIITYDEYMQYCKKYSYGENLNKQNSTVNTKYKKAIQAYSNEKIELTEIEINTEA